MTARMPPPPPPPLLHLPLGLVFAFRGPRTGSGGGGLENFPEQALLAEILAQQIEAQTQLRVERRFYLAGSYICQQALLSGRIDTYVEYTGTALTAILHDPILSDPSAVFGRVRRE